MPGRVVSVTPNTLTSLALNYLAADVLFFLLWRALSAMNTPFAMFWVEVKNTASRHTGAIVVIEVG